METLDFSRLTVQLAFDTSRVQHNLNVIERAVESSAGRIGAIGAAISFAVSAPLQIALAGSIKVFSQLQDAAIRTSSRIKGATESTTKELENMATAISLRIPLASREIEEVADQISRMGGTVKFAKAATEEMSKFAVVMDNMDAREATDAVIKTMKELGLATGDVGHDLNTTQLIMQRMVQVMEATGWQNREVTEAFQKGSAIANEYGMDIDQLAASFTMLYDAGKEGAEAGTSLNIILRSLSDAYAKHRKVFSEAFGEKAAKEWEKADWMTKFDIFYKGMSQKSEDAQKRLAAGLGIGPKQLTHIMPFIERTNIGRNFMGGKMLETGIVDERFKKISESVLSQLTILWNRFKDIGTVLASLVLPPLLMFTNALWGITKAVGTVLDWLGDLPFGLGTVAKFLGRLTSGWVLLGLAMAGPVLIATSAIRGLIGLMGAWTGQTLTFLASLLPIGKGVMSVIGVFLTQGPLKAAIAGVKMLASAFGLLQVKMTMTSFGGPSTWKGFFKALTWPITNTLLPLLTLLKDRFISIAAVIVTAWGKGGIVGVIAQVIASISRLVGANGLIRAMTAFGGPKTLGGLGTAISGQAPYLLTAGLTALGTALFAAAAAAVYFSVSATNKAHEMNKMIHPSLRNTSKGLQFEAMSEDLKNNLLSENSTVSKYSGGIFRGIIKGMTNWDKISQMRTGLNSMLQKGASPEDFAKKLDEAYRYGAIYEEDYKRLQSFMQNQIDSSGFTGMIKGNGSEDYLGDKRRKGDKVDTFTATTLGTSEEYKARVTGQAALVGATTGLLEQAKATRMNTYLTARNTANIASKIGGEKPAGLVP